MDRFLCDNVIALALLLCVCTQDGICSKCCFMWARQLGERCTETLPCDTRRGLQCDYSASFPGDPGECVSQQDLGCEVDGVSYRDGQAFQPSCHTYCRCQAGGVSCVPACPLVARLPAPDCPHPRLLLLPGKCCKEWVCENLDNTVIQDALTAWTPYGLWPDTRTPGTVGNRLTLTNRLTLPAVTCVEQSTRWSSCSQTCGAGVSTRVSNQNPACRMEMQTRLCKIRPCQAVQAARSWTHGQWGRCQASFLSPGVVRLVHQGCYSTRRHRMRYCGQCTDSRCCAPHLTHTAHVSFRCLGGRMLPRRVMVIDSCACHHHCPRV
ncbi:hypothetical protein NHX12_012663 [Muraenolepis orangiensis]|uniref:Connective tissue growth factor n=1 Tax=Muraenolepis orangiensis TaxID=630683 RepID=A0A9Q0DET3_9TELE|nr:hypothetical protein NHX12_012663 [Muraenolepis orangiensis]